tara:strand:+ start:22378 stop:22536 length:159 start_codon:yes stop_codon:yes gene_type:complete
MRKLKVYRWNFGEPRVFQCKSGIGVLSMTPQHKENDVKKKPKPKKGGKKLGY